MSYGFPTDTTKPFTIFIEVSSADEQDANPTEVGEVANQLVEALRIDGYIVIPAETDDRGGEKFEIIPQLQNLYQFGALHKDEIINIFKTVIIPLTKRLNELRQQRLAKLPAKQDVQQPTSGGVKVEAHFTPDSWSVKAESNDYLGTVQIEPLIEQIAARIQSFDEQSQPHANTPALRPFIITINEEVPVKDKPRRRH